MFTSSEGHGRRVLYLDHFPDPEYSTWHQDSQMKGRVSHGCGLRLRMFTSSEGQGLAGCMGCVMSRALMVPLRFWCRCVNGLGGVLRGHTLARARLLSVAGFTQPTRLRFLEAAIPRRENGGLSALVASLLCTPTCAHLPRGEV
ncbi:hypothetical protein NDU88_009456 [Pleurodeles waltl]|uniref:Uncharacterized protein n=1 Tax=Pleurodeles waltl TaxID=8319 RepID=A0AAV7NZ49_PLEWA|nr:hypothetical protein NDU88_009456 [Pleurodeles waltl]